MLLHENCKKCWNPCNHEATRIGVKNQSKLFSKSFDEVNAEAAGIQGHAEVEGHAEAAGMQGHAEAAGMKGHVEATGMKGHDGNISDPIGNNTIVDTHENEDFVSKFWELDNDEPRW